MINRQIVQHKKSEFPILPELPDWLSLKDLFIQKKWG